MTYGEVHAAQKLEFFFSLFLASWCTSILNLWVDLKYENSVLRWYFDTKISRCHDVLWIYGYGVKVAKPKIWEMVKIEKIYRRLEHEVQAGREGWSNWYALRKRGAKRTKCRTRQDLGMESNVTLPSSQSSHSPHKPEFKCMYYQIVLQSNICTIYIHWPKHHWDMIYSLFN